MLQVTSKEFTRDTNRDFDSDAAKSLRLSQAPSLSTGSEVQDWLERQGEKGIDIVHQRWLGDPPSAKLSFFPRYRR